MIDADRTLYIIIRGCTVLLHVDIIKQNITADIYWVYLTAQQK